MTSDNQDAIAVGGKRLVDNGARQASRLQMPPVSQVPSMNMRRAARAMWAFHGHEVRRPIRRRVHDCPSETNDDYSPANVVADIDGPTRHTDNGQGGARALNDLDLGQIARMVLEQNRRVLLPVAADPQCRTGGHRLVQRVGRKRPAGSRIGELVTERPSGSH